MTHLLETAKGENARIARDGIAWRFSLEKSTGPTLRIVEVQLELWPSKPTRSQRKCRKLQVVL